MIDISKSDDGILVLKVKGHLERDELEQVTALLERSLEEHEKTHICVEVEGFRGFDPAALPDYLPRAAAMVSKLTRFGRIAVIADQGWVRFATRLESALLPGIRYEVFMPNERDLALAWVEGQRDLPHASALKVIKTDKPNVIGFELDGRLTAPEIEAISEYFRNVFKQDGPVRLLGRIRNIGGFEPSAVFSGKYMGMKLEALSKVERYAIVGGPAWLRGWVSALGPLVKVEVRHFEANEEAFAWAWLGAEPNKDRKGAGKMRMSEAPSHRELAAGFASPLAAEAAQVAWTTDLITNTGFNIHVRPARPEDEAIVAAFFQSLTQDDLRHRFLTALREVDHERLKNMVRNDDPHSISFLAFERFTGELIATAMLVADKNYDTAEFALSTRPDRRAHGVSWALLDHAARYARDVGIRRLTSLETADDEKALKLEREMGFTVHICPDEATLMLAEKVLH